MTIDDLLALVAVEYADGLTPATLSLTRQLEALTEQERESDPDDVAVATFIHRSIEATQLLGMTGIASFLSHVNNVQADRQATASRATSLIWTIDALRCVDDYLRAPATTSLIDRLCELAAHSPITPHTQWLEALASNLAIAPHLPANEDDVESMRLLAPVADDVALATDAADPQLLASMLHDAPGQLEKLYRLLGAYGTDIAQGELPAPGRLVEAQRIAHTLKGSGNIIGLPGIARIAHRLEDVLVWLDADRKRAAVAAQCAVRDSMLACETLQQMVAHLGGEDDMPSHALSVLQRMHEWAERIHCDDVDSFAPEPVSLAGGDLDQMRRPERALSGDRAADVSVALRLSAEQIGRFVKRAGQSLVSAQRLTQGLREIDSQLNTAQQRQQALRVRLDELQRTVDRQVVALQARSETQSEFDALELDRYDALHLLSRVVAEAVQDQVELTEGVRGDAQRLIAAARDEHRELREQHRELLDARLVAFSSVVPRLRRNIAQTSASLGKHTRLEVLGVETTLDAEVLTKLTEPLLHLLRNAVDHGIEPPEERLLSGKDRQALVTVRCSREGRQIRIDVTDDGRGLNRQAILSRATDLGLIEAHVELSTADLHALILQPGFSTKTDVSDVSGRGIGLDIVNDRVKAMKGSLVIESEPQLGTAFAMRVPVSSGLVQAIIADVAGERVALSSDQVITVLPPGTLAPGVTSVVHGEKALPLASLASWLGFGEGEVQATPEHAVIVAHGAEGDVGLLVDRVLEVRELVLQDIGALLRRVAGVQTGAFSDSGEPLFVIDVPELQSRARSGISMSAALALRKRAAIERTRVLVVDDALSARRAVQQAFEDSGYEVLVASDGFEALDVLRGQTISLIATDLEMPNLNGLELTKRVREVPAWSTIPIIMITSRSGEHHRDMALSVGVNQHFTKPFSNVDLLHAATALLSSRHQSRQPAGIE